MRGKVLKYSYDCDIKSVMLDSKLRKITDKEASWKKILEENSTEAIVSIKKEVS